MKKAVIIAICAIILIYLGRLIMDRKIKFFDFLMRLEDSKVKSGAVTYDTGGATKYGIAQKYHTSVDVPNITKVEAAAIYYTEYFKPLQLSNISSDKLAYIIFDAAVNQGVGTAKKIVLEAASQKSYIDALKLLDKNPSGSFAQIKQIRANRYKSLAQNAKYAKYLTGWLNRLNIIEKEFV